MNQHADLQLETRYATSVLNFVLIEQPSHNSAFSQKFLSEKLHADDRPARIRDDAGQHKYRGGNNDEWFEHVTYYYFLAVLPSH